MFVYVVSSMKLNLSIVILCERKHVSARNVEGDSYHFPSLSAHTAASASLLHDCLWYAINLCSQQCSSTISILDRYGIWLSLPSFLLLMTRQ